MFLAIDIFSQVNLCFNITLFTFHVGGFLKQNLSYCWNCILTVLYSDRRHWSGDFYSKQKFKGQYVDI